MCTRYELAKLNHVNTYRSETLLFKKKPAEAFGRRLIGYELRYTGQV